jgi:hypothetical protein
LCIDLHDVPVSASLRRAIIGGRQNLLLDGGNVISVLRKVVSSSPAPGQDNVGLAFSTLGVQPINGLRHPILRGTTGWYIWCGEIFSDASDFFTPLCIDRLIERLPLVADLLGIPPGYRFLIAGEHPDVWFDKSLLIV